MSNLSKLKLCFLAGTLEHGGAERQLFYVLQALCQAGATPRLLSLDHSEFWEEKIKALGICVTWVGDQPSRLTRLFRVLRELWKTRMLMSVWRRGFCRRAGSAQCATTDVPR